MVLELTVLLPLPLPLPLRCPPPPPLLPQNIDVVDVFLVFTMEMPSIARLSRPQRYDITSWRFIKLATFMSAAAAALPALPAPPVPPDAAAALPAAPPAPLTSPTPPLLPLLPVPVPPSPRISPLLPQQQLFPNLICSYSSPLLLYIEMTQP